MADHDDMLEARAWHLVRGIAMPTGALITARFAGGTISGSTGVNRYRAEYARDGSSLRIGAATLTRMAGEPGAAKAEADFIALLEAVAGHRVTDDTLRLDDAHGDEILAFGLPPRSPTPLPVAGTCGSCVEAMRSFRQRSGSTSISNSMGAVA